MGNHPPSRHRRLRLQYWLSALWRSAAGRSGSPHGVVTGSCGSPNLRTLEIIVGLASEERAVGADDHPSSKVNHGTDDERRAVRIVGTRYRPTEPEPAPPPPDRTGRGTDRPHHPWARVHPARAGRSAGGDRRRAGVHRGGAGAAAVRDERHWLRIAPKLIGHLFPRLLGQSEYNTRLRAAAPLLAAALR